MNDEVIDFAIKYIEKKANLTDLEKDILDSYYELSKSSIERSKIIAQIRKNRKHDILEKEAELVTAQTRGNAISIPLNQLTTDLLISNLKNQLLILCLKYLQ